MKARINCEDFKVIDLEAGRFSSQAPFFQNAADGSLQTRKCRPSVPGCGRRLDHGQISPRNYSGSFSNQQGGRKVKNVINRGWLESVSSRHPAYHRPGQVSKIKNGEACAGSLKFNEYHPHRFLHTPHGQSDGVDSESRQTKSAEFTAGIFRESRGVPGREALQRRRREKMKICWRRSYILRLEGAAHCERREIRTTGLSQKLIRSKQGRQNRKLKSKFSMSNSGPTNNELRE